MPLKKQTFSDDEIAVFDDAVIYKRGDYWHFRMWLAGEGKYARKSLRTRSRSTAIDKGKEAYLEIYSNVKAGKTYFSLTTKEGVAMYVQHRLRDVESGVIVSGRLTTIKTHLQHWLAFIGKDTKLKELERSDCEDYFHYRAKESGKLPVKQVTVQNEQSTINGMMRWLFRNKEAYIDAFDFKKLPRISSRIEDLRRHTFGAHEVEAIYDAVGGYCDRTGNQIDETEWRMRKLACYYFLIASVTGLRTGEQRQMKWGDIEWTYRNDAEGKKIPLSKLSVRAETSKVRQGRTFMCRDHDWFRELRTFLIPILKRSSIVDCFMFSLDGTTPITERALLYHFGRLLKLAEISDLEKRNLVPYSFRHYFITQRIMAGLSYRQIADMCGTSAAQIEKTYYHINEDIMVTNALADYELDEQGLITVSGQ